MVRNRSLWLFAASVIFVAACGAGDGGASNSVADGEEASNGALDRPTSIDNHGGSLEGHTPRGFAGMGTGLFAGDNLNPGFPDGDGVQAWLSFDLPIGIDVPTTASLTSDFLVVQGSPFEDLGNLNAEPVVYEEFSAELFDLPAQGQASTCTRVDDSRIECDVTDAVSAAISAGESRVQFRLKFDVVADNDGVQDLAMFFLTDSNTNEPGIFRLELV